MQQNDVTYNDLIKSIKKVRTISIIMLVLIILAYLYIFTILRADSFELYITNMFITFEDGISQQFLNDYVFASFIESIMGVGLVLPFIIFALVKSNNMIKGGDVFTLKDIKYFKRTRIYYVVLFILYTILQVFTTYYEIRVGSGVYAIEKLDNFALFNVNSLVIIIALVIAESVMLAFKYGYTKQEELKGFI